MAHLKITTFHKSTRLATNTPRTTEEAQYSTSFPCAVALIHGDVRPRRSADDALNDPQVLRLSQAIEMAEDETANAAFPATRMARATLALADGADLHSDWHRARWDPDTQPITAELSQKFHALPDPRIAQARAERIETIVMSLQTATLPALATELCQPISR